MAAKASDTRQKRRQESCPQQRGGNLTGAEVRKRFGVSTLSFYRWRGPVKGRKRPVKGRKRRGRPPGRTAEKNGAIRQEVRAKIATLLPQIIREEVEAYLRDILGRGVRRS